VIYHHCFLAEHNGYYKTMQLETELYFSPLDSSIGYNEVIDSVPTLSD
jgi:hypothetical protein